MRSICAPQREFVDPMRQSDPFRAVLPDVDEAFRAGDLDHADHSAHGDRIALGASEMQVVRSEAQGHGTIGKIGKRAARGLDAEKAWRMA